MLKSKKKHPHVAPHAMIIKGQPEVFVLSQLLSFWPFFMHDFAVWWGFQSSSKYTLQSLYLMCKEKHHKSQKHSSVFSNGSLNRSEDEKADKSLFGRAQNGSYLTLDSSDFWLIYQAVGKRGIQLSSATVQYFPFLTSLMFGYTESTDFQWWLIVLLLSTHLKVGVFV